MKGSPTLLAQLRWQISFMHYFAIDAHQRSLLEEHASNAALKEGVQGVGW